MILKHYSKLQMHKYLLTVSFWYNLVLKFFVFFLTKFFLKEEFKIEMFV